MRQAGKIVAKVHEALRRAVRPGVTTAELDHIAHDVIRTHDAIPTFVGVQPPNVPVAFPAAITASINEELVHGIPGPRVLREGDLVSLDCAVTYKGYIGDAAFSMGVGTISPEAQRLIDVAERSLMAGITAARAGREIRDIALAIQAVVEGAGFVSPREYTGHGVGREMWEPPSVPNWWPRGRRTRRWRNYPLQVGMTLALEPMLIAGKWDVTVLPDHWTVVSADGSLCAHVEHSIAITDGDPLILTLP
jgi:methionyl aminopeptidase